MKMYICMNIRYPSHKNPDTTVPIAGQLVLGKIEKLNYFPRDSFTHKGERNKLNIIVGYLYEALL